MQKRFVIIISSLSLVSVLLLGMIGVFFIAPGEALTEGEAKEIVLQQYPGQIKEIIHRDNLYVTKLVHEHAAAISSEHLPGGEVDDVELRQTKNSVYYLVEIEFEDDREATVQINAISGAVMSVTWDD